MRAKDHAALPATSCRCYQRSLAALRIGDPAEDDHLVARLLERPAEDRGGIVFVPAGHLPPGARDARGRVAQTVALGVLADVAEERGDGALDVSDGLNGSQVVRR